MSVVSIYVSLQESECYLLVQKTYDESQKFKIALNTTI